MPEWDIRPLKNEKIFKTKKKFKLKSLLTQLESQDKNQAMFH